jgi:NAD(P)-dependent dehydrogenase (short-subunit alcohol dehydrogenase family)
MPGNVSVIIGMGGMGRAIARRIGAGSELLLADYQVAALEEVADQLRGDGFSVQTCEIDVSSRESVAAVAATAKQMGSVTRLVSTAGVAPVHAPIEAILSVNLLGAAYVIEEFADVVAPGAAAVVIASNAGYLFPDDLDAKEMLELATLPAAALSALPVLSAARFADRATAYGFAKHMCRLRVQAAAAGRWGERGARINSISPGVIATPMGRAELVGDNQRLVQGLIDASPARRAGTAEEIANVVDFLLGSAASFVTGADIVVDGGAVAAIKTGRFNPVEP